MSTQTEIISNSIYLDVAHDITPMNFIELATLVKDGKLAEKTVLKVFLASTLEEENNKEFLFYFNGFDFSYAHYNIEKDTLTISSYDLLDVNTDFVNGEYTPVGIWLN